MIDLENDIFTHVATAVRTAFPGTYVVGEFVDVPARFPAVTIVEADNRVVERMRTLNIENAARVMYEANIYSSKSAGKKTQAKEIANTVDTAFTECGLTRTFREQVPNLNDSTIYRIVCRYEGIIGLPGADGKYLVYHN